jgi:hypothetical protein
MEATESLKYPSLTTRDASPSRAVLEDLKLSPSDGCPATATYLASTQALRSRRVSSADSRLRRCTPVRPVLLTGQTGTHRSDWSGTAAAPSSVLRSWLCGSTKEPPETPRTRCSLRQSPLMTWLPRSPDSTLVLRLNQETVHDFILLFMPPCGPHLTSLATGSLERSLLVFSTPGGLTGDGLSRLFFTCTNTNQAATCTCNT